MVGCCKFGPCRKKRTYEFNNPPYTENKDDGVYHSHKQKLTGNQDRAVKNGSAGMSRTNPAFEGGADNVEFNGAAVVDLDSECNSIAEDGGAAARRPSKHKENAEGFKSADLVVASGNIKRKDSKRSSKSSHSSSSSSSKSSKRSSKHSDVVVVVKDDEDKHSEHVEIAETVTTVDDIHTEVSGVESHIVTTETRIEEVEGGAVAYPEGEGHDSDTTSGEVVVVRREEITKVTEDGEVTRVEITQEVITNDDDNSGEVTRVEITEEVITKDDEGDKTPERRKSDSSHSSKSSSSSDANSYRLNEEEPNEDVDENIENEANEQDEQAGAAGGSGSSNSSGEIEAPPGIEELDNAANDMVQDGSYTVTHITEEVEDGSYTVTQVTEEVSVYAHGDEEEHGETGSEDL